MWRILKITNDLKSISTYLEDILKISIVLWNSIFIIGFNAKKDLIHLQFQFFPILTPF